MLVLAVVDDSLSILLHHLVVAEAPGAEVDPGPGLLLEADADSAQSLKTGRQPEPVIGLSEDVYTYIVIIPGFSQKTGL